MHRSDQVSQPQCRHRFFGLALGTVLTALVASTCKHPSSALAKRTQATPPASTQPNIAPSSSVSASASRVDPPEPLERRPPPLDNPDPFAFLPVPEHGDAVVSLPLGTRDRRPIVIATHGNYDTPEWQCSVWRDIIGNDAFVLCPRGVARGDSPSRSDIRYQYVSNRHLEKEIDAAIISLRTNYPAYVGDGPMVFTGFSQGAIMGASIMARHPNRFPRAVLIEGGNRTWYAANAKKFADGGGARIVFACGQWVCHQRSTTAKRNLIKQGVEARVTFRKGQGHTYGGGVAQDVAAQFDWLVQDDPRWEHRRKVQKTNDANAIELRAVSKSSRLVQTVHDTRNSKGVK